MIFRVSQPLDLSLVCHSEPGRQLIFAHAGQARTLRGANAYCAALPRAWLGMGSVQIFCIVASDANTPKKPGGVTTDDRAGEMRALVGGTAKRWPNTSHRVCNVPYAGYRAHGQYAAIDT